ncbi:MAG: S-layer homology domain-containing protein, partial [Clostridia bacterium]|nr:S-layer homology domain-containing protein [Clostridia bacterium]
PSDAYYAKAVAWASENGLTSGVTDKSFAPELNITREQIAVFLYRYAQYKSMDVSAKGDIASFDDADSISSWAQQAMEWAVGSGIINGSDGKLMAGNNATRAEVAAMLMRFIEK